MWISDVSKACMLTKKAIEYYIEQGLVSPRICENGYRDFSQSDVDKLKKISLLRKLDLGMESIRSVLSSDDPNKILRRIAHEKELELDRAKYKGELLESLGQDGSWEEVDHKLKLLSDKQTIMEKLMDAFPGYYGKFVSLHFGQFLNEPIVTEEQKDAYKVIIEFLDNIDNFSISHELESFWDENTGHITTESMKDITTNMVHAVRDIDKFMKENKEFIEKYIVYKNSDEYKNSHTHKLQSLLYDFNSTSGYYDTFIPNMIKLSPQYANYHSMLEASNKALMTQYPDLKASKEM